MKKVLAFVLALAMMLTMAVTVASAEDVTLTMWIWDDAQAPAMQAMIDGFTAQNPGIKVELTSVAGVTDYNTKMQAVFGSADAPSVFWMNFNLSKEYVPMGFVQDLTEAVTTYGIDMSKLNAGITDATPWTASSTPTRRTPTPTPCTTTRLCSTPLAWPIPTTTGPLMTSWRPLRL